MKFLRWMQGKFNGGQGGKRPNADHNKQEPPKEEFSDWPHGLLAVGTFGNTGLRNNRAIQTDLDSETKSIPQESHDFSGFSAGEAVKIEKEWTKQLTIKTAANNPDPIVANQSRERFLNCPSSLEVDSATSSRLSTYSDGEEIDQTIRIILERCKEVSEKKNKTVAKRSLAFLFKKMYDCTSGSLPPTPSSRDTFQESRMEKLMRTLLTKKIYSQDSNKTSSSKKCLEDYNPTSRKKEREDEWRDQSRKTSQWDKTDSDYIVLEI